MWFYLIPFLICFIKLTIQQGSNSNYLLVANSTAIYKFNESNHKFTPIIRLPDPEDDAVKSFDYSYNDRLIFWLNRLDSSINVHNIETGRKVNLFRNEKLAPECFAIDWITKKIYWINTEPYRIEVVDFNGRNNSLILLLSDQVPKSIALAPLNGLLFWNDNQNAVINRISMNGDPTTMKQIIRNTNANAIAVHHSLKKIFWTDMSNKKIKSSDFDGEHQREIQVTFASSIAIHQNRVYYSDSVSRTIRSFDPMGGKASRSLVEFNDSPQLVYFSQTNQPDQSSVNPCSINNGQCSHLCLLSSVAPHFSCACEAGLPLESNNRTCKQFPDKYLLIAFVNQIGYISLNTNDYLPKTTRIKQQDRITAIDFDPVEQRIYWIDRNKVKSGFLNGTHTNVITECELEYERLQIDVLNRNIYLVKNSKTGTKNPKRHLQSISSNFSIEVVSLDGKFKKTLIDDQIDLPRAIAIDVENEFFYWSDWGRKPKIEKVSFNLTVREPIIETGISWPNAIVIDQSLRRLYWCDARLQKIESTDLNGSDRQILVKLNVTLDDLTLLDDYIYFIDSLNNQIGRVHKLTGQLQMISNREQKLQKLMGLNAVSSSNQSTVQQVKRRSCSQLSISSDLCECSNGYRLQDDQTTCLLGQDSCKISNGDCEHHCNQLIGNYRKCSCYDGFALDLDQRKCKLAKDPLRSLPECDQSPAPCSHKCVMIEGQIHCSCPVETMYLGKDNKTCFYLSALNHDPPSDNAVSMKDQNEFSTLTVLIIGTLTVLLFVAVILCVRFLMKKQKEKKFKNSKEHIIKPHSNDRRIDFGHSLSNVESSILCDRSLGVGASAMMGENRSLLDPPPSPDNMSSVSKQYHRIPRFNRNNLNFNDYQTNFDDINEFDTSFDPNLDDDQLSSNIMSNTTRDVHSSCIFVPPPTPMTYDEENLSIYRGEDDERIYNGKQKTRPTDLNSRDEFVLKRFMNDSNCNSSLQLDASTSTYHLLNPPNSLNSSFANLKLKKYDQN